MHLWRSDPSDEESDREGRRYTSLSHIARAITGAHWSEPRLFGLPGVQKRQTLLAYELRFELSSDAITVVRGTGKHHNAKTALPARLVAHGPEKKLELPPEDPGQGINPDPVLIRLLVHADAAQRTMLDGSEEPSVSHYGKRHFWQLLRIGLFAPDIVSAIIDRRHPAGLTDRRLLRAANLPLDWAKQRDFLGFA